MDKIKLSILGISYNQTKSGAYALILSEDGGKRRVPIIIGGSEAQAIAIHLEGLKPPRPLTHDLFVNFSEAFSISLKEIFIYKMNDGVFYSEILFDDGKNRIRIDSRTSDAVALAIRFDAPIYIDSKVMDVAGLEIDVQEEDVEEDTNEENIDEEEVFDVSVKISNLTDEELNIALQESIKDENYELSALIKEEIQHRKAE